MVMLPRELCAYHVIAKADGADGQEYGYRLMAAGPLVPAAVPEMRERIEFALAQLPVRLGPLSWRIGWDL